MSIVVKPEHINVRLVPVDVKLEPVDVKLEPAEVKLEPVEVKLEPVEVKLEPVEVKLEPTEDSEVNGVEPWMQPLQESSSDEEDLIQMELDSDDDADYQTPPDERCVCAHKQTVTSERGSAHLSMQVTALRLKKTPHNNIVHRLHTVSVCVMDVWFELV